MARLSRDAGRSGIALHPRSVSRVLVHAGQPGDHRLVRRQGAPRRRPVRAGDRASVYRQSRAAPRAAGASADSRRYRAGPGPPDPQRVAIARRQAARVQRARPAVCHGSAERRATAPDHRLCEGASPRLVARWAVAGVRDVDRSGRDPEQDQSRWSQPSGAPQHRQRVLRHTGLVSGRSADRGREGSAGAQNRGALCARL